MNKRKKFFVAISLLMVSVLLLSTGVYAWFSMSRNVKASGMGMEATGTSSLLLSKSGIDGTFSDALDLNAEKVYLLPTSSVNGALNGFYYAQAKGITDTGSITENVTEIYKFNPADPFSEYDDTLLAKNNITNPNAYAEYTFYLKASARNDVNESIYARFNFVYNGMGSGFKNVFRYTMFIEEDYVALDLHTVAADECDETTDAYYGFNANDVVINDNGAKKLFNTYLSENSVKVTVNETLVDATYETVGLNENYVKVTAEAEASKIYGLNFKEGDVLVKNTEHVLTNLGVDSTSAVANQAYTAESVYAYAVQTLNIHTVVAGEFEAQGNPYYGFNENDKVVVEGTVKTLLADYLTDNNIVTLEDGDQYYDDLGVAHKVNATTYVKKTGKIIYFKDAVPTYDESKPIAVVEAKETRVIPVTIRVWLDGEDAAANSINFVQVTNDYNLEVEFSLDQF